MITITLYLLPPLITSSNDKPVCIVGLFADEITHEICLSQCPYVQISQRLCDHASLVLAVNTYGVPLSAYIPFSIS
jgi:hypothetical protein